MAVPFIGAVAAQIGFYLFVCFATQEFSYSEARFKIVVFSVEGVFHRGERKQEKYLLPFFAREALQVQKIFRSCYAHDLFKLYFLHFRCKELQLRVGGLQRVAYCVGRGYNRSLASVENPDTEFGDGGRSAHSQDDG